MAVNRFDKPVEQEYVSSYIPIPFQELLLLGKQYGDQRRAAEEELASNIKTFGKFVSPSKVDMENYRRESIGQLTPFLEQAAANPNVMKDSAWRSQLQSAINNINYTKLGMYEQSAANLNARLQNIAKMEVAGKYNPNWDDLNISSWNSDTKGVMNDLTPIEYQTLEAFGTPYADKLKPTFYKGVDPNSGASMPYTNWMSITRDDIARQFTQHINDIKADPKGAKHYRDITNAYLQQHPNATQEELDAIFVDALTTRQSDKIISTPVVDQVGLQYASWAHQDALEARKLANKLAVANAKKSKEEEKQLAYIPPRKMVSAQFMSNYNDYAKRNLTDKTRTDYKEDQAAVLKNKNEADFWLELMGSAKQNGAPTDVVNEYFMNSLSYRQKETDAQTKLSRKEFSNMYGDNKISTKDFDSFKKDVDWTKFNKVSQDLIDNMGGEITLTDSNDLLKHVATPTKIVWSGGETEGFALSSSAEVVLPFRLASVATSLSGELPMNKDPFVQAFEAGLYRNIKIVPQARGTVFSDTTSPSGKREYVKATAIINLDGVDLNQYHWGQSISGTALSWYEEIYDFIFGENAENTTKALGGKYNPDTNTAEIEVYVPLGESAQQAEQFNFERNKNRFGTTTNTEDRYNYTDMTSQQRLNTGYYGEEDSLYTE